MRGETVFLLPLFFAMWKKILCGAIFFIVLDQRLQWHENLCNKTARFLLAKNTSKCGIFCIWKNGEKMVKTFFVRCDIFRKILVPFFFSYVAMSLMRNVRRYRIECEKMKKWWNQWLRHFISVVRFSLGHNI